MRSRDEVLREFDWGGAPYTRTKDPFMTSAIEDMADRIRELEAQQAASEPVQRCESGCGPATMADADGVPLCDSCAWDLDREVLQEIATLVGFDRDKHDDLTSLVKAKLAPVAASEPVAWVVLYCGGYTSTDVDPVGVFASQTQAEKAASEHTEPGNCFVVSCPAYLAVGCPLVLGDQTNPSAAAVVRVTEAMVAEACDRLRLSLRAIDGDELTDADMTLIMREVLTAALTAASEGASA